MCGGVDEGAARLQADGDPVKSLGRSDNGTVAIKDGHMRIRVVEAGEHGGGDVFLVLAAEADGCAEQDRLFAGANGDSLDDRIHRHAAKAAADAHDETAPLARCLHLPCRRCELAIGDIRAVRTGIEKIVNIVLAEQGRTPTVRPQHPGHIPGKQHDGLAAGKRQAHPLVDGDVDEGILLCGHIQACV